MSNLESRAIAVHTDIELFREAVNFTAAETTFPAALIEKDYFCTLLLVHLMDDNGPHVFQGGTCLAKVHAEFYRLSEDLDFTIPTPVGSNPSIRRGRAAILKPIVAAIPAACPCFRLTQPLRGANRSLQYIAVVTYESQVTGRVESVKIEVSQREPLLMPVAAGLARTILLDPVSGRALVPPVPVRCISKIEAFAEKFRAAMTRREVAIRDYYDIDYAVRHRWLRPSAPEFVQLVKHKLALPGTEPVNVDPMRLADLHSQLDARLRPVLRDRDLLDFDLDRAFSIVGRMAIAVGTR